MARFKIPCAQSTCSESMVLSGSMTEASGASYVTLRCPAGHQRGITSPRPVRQVLQSERAMSRMRLRGR